MPKMLKYNFFNDNTHEELFKMEKYICVRDSFLIIQNITHVERASKRIIRNSLSSVKVIR